MLNLLTRSVNWIYLSRNFIKPSFSKLVYFTFHSKGHNSAICCKIKNFVRLSILSQYAGSHITNVDDPVSIMILIFHIDSLRKFIVNVGNFIFSRRFDLYIRPSDTPVFNAACCTGRSTSCFFRFTCIICLYVCLLFFLFFLFIDDPFILRPVLVSILRRLMSHPSTTVTPYVHHES